MRIRLDKYLADMKAGTRSEVKEYIRKGAVSVNDSICCKPETKVDTEADTVLLNGASIGYVDKEYYMLNKPAGVVTATTDKREKTVLDLIFPARKDLFPAGRLDKDTEGLLVITNDGEMAHYMLSPKHHVDKTYYAVVKGRILDETVHKFSEGLYVDDELTAKPSKLEVLSYDAENDTSCVNITIHEGKFHQIKRMFVAVGSEVLYLKRISFGPLSLDESLQPGQYRALTEEEVGYAHQKS